MRLAQLLFNTVNVTTYSSSETRPESSGVSMKGFIIIFFPFPFH